MLCWISASDSNAVSVILVVSWGRSGLAPEDCGGGSYR